SAIYELYDQCINGRNMTLLDNLISEDFPGPRGTHGVQAFQAGVEGLIHAFPDIHYELTSVVAADDKVAVSWQWTGTSTSAFLQYPANGKKITNDGMAIFTFRNGHHRRHDPNGPPWFPAGDGRPPDRDRQWTQRP